MPMPSPPVGGKPCSRTLMKSISSLMASSLPWIVCERAERLLAAALDRPAQWCTRQEEHPQDRERPRPRGWRWPQG